MVGGPLHQAFWFASRAFGITAMVGLAASVMLGLGMSTRIVRRPGLPAKLKRLHESLTLVTLGLIVIHGGLLLFDAYLRPGLAGIAVPFAMHYRPAFTGMGIIAGWSAAILGLTFYVRRWIGTRTWRFMHRFTILAYLLAVIHAVGAGTDARSPWMLALLTAITAPVVFLFTYRVLPAKKDRDGGTPAGAHGAYRRPRSPEPRISMSVAAKRPSASSSGS